MVTKQLRTKIQSTIQKSKSNHNTRFTGGTLVVIGLLYASGVGIGLPSNTPLSIFESTAHAFQDTANTPPTENPAQVKEQPADYQNYNSYTNAIETLGNQYPDSLRIQSIGKSRQNRDIWALTLALNGNINPDKRPALLIVAGIDGSHLLGSATAVDLTNKLLKRAANGDDKTTELLTNHTLYVVPRVNPDGMERYFNKVKYEFDRNTRPDDADRDQLTDEDGPNDLNGDGLITQMRVFDPDEADQMPDPADPRLNVKPDPMKGEHSLFKIYTEGIDDDGDGLYNEDGLGGVDLNMNFMHGYPEHKNGAGPYPVSEPESLSLLQFTLAHQNIAIALTYGKDDNLSTTPNGKGTHKSGTPKNILPDDVAVYKVIGESFRNITGLKKANAGNPDGSFYEWAYAQFGVPSFTTPLWSGPAGAAGKNTKKDNAGKHDNDNAETLEPSGIGDIAQVTIDELKDAAEAQGMEVSDEDMAQITPAQIEQFAGMMKIEVKHVNSKENNISPTDDESTSDQKDENSDKEKAKNPRSKDEAAWLKYSDEKRNGSGFVPWKKYNHPDFGEVEIGGWTPYFRTNPPAANVSKFAEKQADFILDLANRFPEVSLTDPIVKHLTGGLYQIEISLVNDGFLPTGTAMSVRNQRARPYVVRLSTPIENIISGNRITKIWKIDGSGGRNKMKWIVRAPDASKITVTVYSEKYGQFTKEFKLIPTE